jgi:inner membrane protein
MSPAEASPTLVAGAGQAYLRLTLLGSKAARFARPGAKFRVSSALKFSGAQRIGVLCYGKTTRMSAQGDWPNPGFDGGFLPVRRVVTRKGFTAEWSAPFIARGVRAQAPASSIHGLDATLLGISFIELADPYQSVSRSLKYLLLFVGLVFLSYFTFEVTSGKRAHPAQYLLVGIAQTIFYLLLLSLAERVGFDWGFLAAGLATVLLLAVNAAWVFASRLQGFRALGVFSLLYGLIYYLLRAEDSALLVGSIASFLAVAAVMYLTREIDWHGVVSSPAEAAGPASMNLD